MTVGLPGAGIGGLFYVASTLLLPVRDVLRALRGQPALPGRRSHGLQVGLAIGILVAVWLTGWLLGFIVPPGTVTAAVVIAGESAQRNIIRLAMLGVAAGTLAAILISVEVARLTTQRKRRSARPSRARRWS